MPSLTIRDLPDRLHRHLKQQARRNRRSLNSEVIAALERSASIVPHDPEEALRRANAVHALIGQPLPDLVNEGIDELRHRSGDEPTTRPNG